MTNQLNISTECRNESYYDQLRSGKIMKQAAKVRDQIFAANDGITIGELSRAMGLPKGTISARIKEIRHLLIQCGKRVDPYSKKSVTVWKQKPEPELFTHPEYTKKEKLEKIKRLCQDERVMDVQLRKYIIDVIG